MKSTNTLPVSLFVVSYSNTLAGVRVSFLYSECTVTLICLSDSVDFLKVVLLLTWAGSHGMLSEVLFTPCRHHYYRSKMISIYAFTPFLSLCSP